MKTINKLDLLQATPFFTDNSKRLTDIKKELKEEFGIGYTGIYNQLKHIKKAIRTINRKVTKKQEKLINSCKEYINIHNKVAEYPMRDGELVQIAGAYYARVYKDTYSTGSYVSTIVNFSGRPMTPEIMEGLFAIMIKDYSIDLGIDRFIDTNVDNVDYIDVVHVHDMMGLLWEVELEKMEMFGEWIDKTPHLKEEDKEWVVYWNFTNETLLEEAKDIDLKNKREEELKNILEKRYMTHDEISREAGANVMVGAFISMGMKSHLNRIFDLYNITKEEIDNITEAEFKSFRKKVLAKVHPDKNNGYDRDFLIAKADMEFLTKYMVKERVGIRKGVAKSLDISSLM